MKKIGWFLICVAILGLATLLNLSTALALDFYKGKTIRLIVGYAAGAVMIRMLAQLHGIFAGTFREIRR
jgi:hypothetical protein